MTAIADKDAAYIHELEARLWRSVETAKQTAARIEALEAALREIADKRKMDAVAAVSMQAIARAALAPEEEK
jgi:RPA family protein